MTAHDYHLVCPNAGLTRVRADGTLEPIDASDARSLKANAEDLLHEAQLMALMAEVIMQPGFDYYDDESYAGHSAQLRDASVALSQAVETENFEAARQAIGNMSKACSNCHDEWR